MDTSQQDSGATRGEKKAGYNRKYYLANREKEAARGKAYREANREKIEARRRARRRASREKIVEVERICERSGCDNPIPRGRRKSTRLCSLRCGREARREQIAAYMKEYREANRSKLASQRKVYEAINRPRRAAWGLNRRACDKVTPEQLSARLAMFPGFEWEDWGRGPGKWHWDHILPLSEDGRNLASNLRPEWSDKNIRKGAKDAEIFSISELLREKAKENAELQAEIERLRRST